MIIEEIIKHIITGLESNPQKHFSQENIYYIYTKIKGGNFNISDIYTCLKELKYYLYINNIKANSEKEFGELLRKNRKLLNITRLNLLTENNVSFTIINKIESGKNCRKDSLNKYLIAFPNLKFEIKNL